MLDTDSKERIIKIVVDSSGAKSGVDSLMKSLLDIDAKLDKLGQSIMGAFSGIKNALLSFVSIEGIRSQLMSLADSFDRIGSKAATLGVGVAWLQAFEYQAASSTVRLADAGAAFDKFARLVGEAATGQKGAVDTFRELGIRVLDASGKVRPLTDLFSENAKALMGMDSAAVRVAKANETMGKGAERVIPMLAGVAAGADSMIETARKAGAVVDEHWVAAWERLAASSEKSMVKWRAYAGQNFAEPMQEALSLFSQLVSTTLKELVVVEQAIRKVPTALGEWIAEANQFSDRLVLLAATAADNFIAGFKAIGPALKGVFVDAMNGVIETVESGINLVNKNASSWFVKDKKPISLGRVDGGPAPEPEPNAYLGTLTGQAVIAGIGTRDYQAELAERRRIQAHQDFWAKETADSRYEYDPSAGAPRVGDRFATARNTGGGGTDRSEKRLAALDAEAAAQKRMAEAALQGAAAVAEQEIKWKAAQLALDVYGKEIDENDPRMKGLIDRLKSTADDKALTQFRLQTQDMERQNDVLAKRVELFGEAPEIVAREIVALQVRNELLKDGAVRSQEEIDRRIAAAETTERLNQKLADRQQAQQLWLDPVKQTLRDITQYGTDMWSKILDGGKLTFESIGDMAKQMGKKVAAEFLSLATVRPVIGITVAAMNSAGIMPTSYAQQLGYGSYLSSSSSGGGMGGGFGLLGGGFGDWLNSPISFGGALNTSAASPASMMAPTGATGATLGGLTWGQGIAGAAGIGAGIYGLATSKTPSGMIGSGLGIVGSGVGLASAMGLIGAAGGPIGMAIGAIGAILASTGVLDGLFGNTNPTINDQTYAQLQYSSDGWFTTGGAWGPSANSTDTERGLKGVGNSISAVFSLLGGVKDPGKVWGLSAQNKTTTGKDWSYSSDSLYLVDPSGNQQLWRSNEQGMMDTGSAQVAYRSILGGAAGEISENMRLAVTKTGQTMGGSSLQAIAETVAEILAFDKAVGELGKTVTTAESAIAQIDASFASMYATADKYGLATTDVDSAKNKARLAYATDFGKSISRGILEMTDPQAAALQDLDSWKSSMLDNNKWLLENVVGALDQVNEIERLYGLKRAAIVEQFADQSTQAVQQSLNGLQDALKRLTMGDLAGLSSTDALAGSKATYMALAAKADANPNDAAIANKLGAAATDYAAIAQSHFASSPAYEAIRQQIVVQLAKAAVNVGGNTAATELGDLTQVLAVIGQQVANLTVQLTTATNDNTELKARLAEVTALYLRLAGNQ